MPADPVPEDLAFWRDRYLKEHTPWDLGGPHPALVARLEKDLLGRRAMGHGARAFVPGCGRGHDALALARTGWRVTAVDVVEELRTELQPALEPYGGRFVLGDALEYLSTPPYELLWEHTFFCALPPSARPRYGEMAGRLVAFRGLLAALVTPTERSREAGGPPYRMTTEDLAEALGKGFQLVEDSAVAQAAHPEGWGEHFAVFKRLDDRE